MFRNPWLSGTRTAGAEIVLAPEPAPVRVSFFAIDTCSTYLPLATEIVSPAEATLTACWTCLHGLFLLQVGLSTPDGDTYLVVLPTAAAASTNTLSESSPMAASIARFIAPPFPLRSVVAGGSQSLLPAR